MDVANQVQGVRVPLRVQLGDAVGAGGLAASRIRKVSSSLRIDAGAYFDETTRQIHRRLVPEMGRGLSSFD